MSDKEGAFGFRHWVLGLRGAAVWLWLALIVIFLDQASKWYVVQNFEYATPHRLLAVLDITYLRNTGAAFSFLAGASGWQRWFFITLGLGASVFIMAWLRRLPTRGQGWLAASLALILGGALGNVIDRVLHGYVIDFVHLHYRDWYWPAFNVADSAITVGAVIFLLASLVDGGNEKRTSGT